MKIAVIGSGIAGIATAIRLAAKGHDVDIFEKNERPGGKMSELRKDNFRFDTGPSLLTMPELIKDVFESAGESLDLDANFFKLGETCRYFYPDGKNFVAYSDREKFIDECQRVFDERPVHVVKYLDDSARLYEQTADIFLFNSLHKVKNFLKWSVMQSFAKLHKLKFYKSMHRENKSRFRSPQLVQLFDRYATYNGSSPYRAPATLNIIAHLEHNMGAFFPKRGMYSIIELLTELAKRKGVRFHSNTKVEHIVAEKNRAKGLLIRSEFLSFDHIISNADTKYVAENMIKHPKSKRLQKMEPSSSALIFYWAVTKQFPQLGVHNILFSNNYEQEFKYLFDLKTLYNDPTVYIFSSSKIVQSDAPENCENWFVMINAPANIGQNWDELIEAARDNIKTKIIQTLNVNIDEHIRFEQVASPLSIEADTLSSGGALYGTSSNSMFSAFLRHPNFLRRFKNISFVGGSVHPGGGIPLCLASAKIVADEFEGA